MKRLLIETPTRDQQILDGICRDMERRIGASPVGLCPVDQSLNFLRMCHAQTCGKCVPCRVGLGQLAKLLEAVLDGTASEKDIDLIERTAAVIADTADCAIGYGSAAMVLKSVRGFKEDYLSHVRTGRCASDLKRPVPCVAVCPAHVDIPGYIALAKAGRYEDAVRLIRKDNPFPAVCGYVCEHPCEARCRRITVDDVVNICGIKRYAVDHASSIPTPPCAEPTGKTVAVVGGGPAGLTAAYFLTLMGHKVTVYEQRPKLGGMLRYGIPDYRLPQDVLDGDIQYILDTGVEAVTNTSVGKDIQFDEIKEKYDVAYISIGAHDDKKLGIEGEDANGVVSAVQLLLAAGEGNLPDLSGKRVAVIGGGNVAMDACRTSLRLGAKSVTCVYRRRVDDMTALKEEIEEAQAEGVEMMTLHAPDHIEANAEGNVTALWAQPQIISAVGADGRTGVRKADKELVRIPCDYIVVAIGQAINAKPFEEHGVRLKRGNIMADDFAYVAENIFAGGDAVYGPATVIRAVAAGKAAAANIDSYLGFDHKISVDVDIPAPALSNATACGRVQLTARGIEDIAGDFDLVSVGMSKEECDQECGRCLRCDHFGYGLFRGGRNYEW